MEKKDWKEELWLRVSPTVLEHGKGFGDITLGGATDQQGKENILKAFEQEIDRDREEEREKVLMIVSVVLMANFGNGANELMQIIKSKLTK